ncbi:MAG: hypothetical protein CMB80_02605 [Flammeovirgaceae bacterium]|nr:hypothetical protein [Flammeovirgaceae bacterium]|tara:strand:- start:146 stop:394 length:249 start_codon:yes stop_codon:yes gene_type:complete
MNIISSLQEVVTSEEPILFETKDGSIIHIEPEDAHNLVKIHDNMNQENQVKMRHLLETSEEDFNKILSFCHIQVNEGDEDVH